MTKLLKGLTTSFLISMMVLGTPVANAFTLMDLKIKIPNLSVGQDAALQITDVKVGESDSDESYSQPLSFCINEDAYVKVGMYEKKGSTNVTVQILEEKILLKKGCYSTSWNGKYADGKLANKDGEYYYGIEGTDKDNSSDTEVVTGWVTYTGENKNIGNTAEEDLVQNLKANPAKFDPKEDEEIKISFDLTLDAEVDVQIYDEDDKLVETLEDEEDLNDGDYDYEWNAEDEDDGDYYVKVTAKSGSLKDIDKKDIEIETGAGSSDDAAELEDAFSTKDSFDPELNEETNVVFTINTESDVEINVYKGSTKVDDLYDENDLEKGSYSVEWDGGNAPYGEYKIEIIAENNEGEDKAELNVSLEEDDGQDDYPNVYADSISPVIIDENGNFEVELRLDEDAEYVNIEIYKKGTRVATVYEDEMEEGKNKVSWDSSFKNGVYDYKITAEGDDTESKEWGKFLVADEGTSDNDDSDDDDKEISGKCANFTDVSASNELCPAIKWAQENGIFDGYTSGAFVPYQPINRAEALKVILETFDFGVNEEVWGNYGFSDVFAGSWYAKYIVSGTNYGIVKGYSDGTFKPGKQVSKVEAIAMTLNAATMKSGISVPYCGEKVYSDTDKNAWYANDVCYIKYHALTEDGAYFYPNKLFTRGEMAELLYTFYQAGLVK